MVMKSPLGVEAKRRPLRRIFRSEAEKNVAGAVPASRFAKLGEVPPRGAKQNGGDEAQW